MTEQKGRPAAGRSRAVVGNDLVDLDAPRMAERGPEAKLWQRVLDPGERLRLAQAPDLERALWGAWAAKEAAFKVVSKELGRPPPFEHRRFVTEAAWVQYRERRYPLRLIEGTTFLHAVVCGGAGPADVRAGVEPLSLWCGGSSDGLGRLRPCFSAEEFACVHSLASAAARLAARRAAAEALGVSEGRLEITCGSGPPGRRPPRLRLDGAFAPMDVSLSHHGAWVAWALLPHPAGELIPRTAGS